MQEGAGAGHALAVLAALAAVAPPVTEAAQQDGRIFAAYQIQGYGVFKIDIQISVQKKFSPGSHLKSTAPSSFITKGRLPTFTSWAFPCRREHVRITRLFPPDQVQDSAEASRSSSSFPGPQLSTTEAPILTTLFSLVPPCVKIKLETRKTIKSRAGTISNEPVKNHHLASSLGMEQVRSAQLLDSSHIWAAGQQSSSSHSGETKVGKRLLFKSTLKWYFFLESTFVRRARIFIIVLLPSFAVKPAALGRS